MIQEITKDITTVEKGVILHGCNCSGIAYGAGVAGAIRRKWPHAYEAFKENGSGERLLGTTMFLMQNEDIPLVIANGYTQVNYGGDGKRYADMEAVESCFRAAVEFAKVYEKELFVPKIGCGLGGLSWEDEVYPMFLLVSQENPEVNIFICDL